MTRLFALFGLFALLLAAVHAQTESSEESLCEINFLRLAGDTNMGDFICGTSDSAADLEPSNATLLPLVSANISHESGDDDEGHHVLKFTKSGLTGTYNSSIVNGSSIFTVLVGFSEAESEAEGEEEGELESLHNETLPSAVIASLSYDFDGDSVIDRVEVFQVFLVNKTDANSTSELASEDGFFAYVGTSEKLLEVVGEEYSDLVNGTIQLSIWSPFGSSSLLIKIGADNETAGEVSSISFPYDFGGESEGTEMATSLGTATVLETGTATVTATGDEDETEA